MVRRQQRENNKLVRNVQLNLICSFSSSFIRVLIDSKLNHSMHNDFDAMQSLTLVHHPCVYCDRITRCECYRRLFTRLRICAQCSHRWNHTNTDVSRFLPSHCAFFGASVSGERQENASMFQIFFISLLQHFCNKYVTSIHAKAIYVCEWKERKNDNNLTSITMKQIGISPFNVCCIPEPMAHTHTLTPIRI